MKNVIKVACVVVTQILLVGCTLPYRHPVIEEPTSAAIVNDPSFLGIASLMSATGSPRETPRVLWTHGMCTHDQLWAEGEARELARAIGGTAHIDTSQVSATRPYAIPVTITTPSKGSIEVTFLVWSPLTAAYKSKLLAIHSRNPYERATINNSVKTKLIDDCFSDVVTYAGPNGAAMRAFMFDQVCSVLGGTTSGSLACHFAGESPRYVALVGESLGSKMLFDAIKSIWDSYRAATKAERLEVERRISAIRMVFMLANQVPLLDEASHTPNGEAQGGQAIAQSSNSTIDEFATILARSASDTARRSMRPKHVIRIVAFSDPNDLLSYRLLPDNELAGVELINVIVSNDTTYFGLLENPYTAHVCYNTNPSVIGLLALGHKRGAPIQSIPIEKNQPCL